MSTIVWKQLGSPDLSRSTIALCAWDGHHSQPLGLYHNFLVTVADKTICIDIEVINPPLDYNILLGRSYTYAMAFFASTVHRKMLFPHNVNIVKIDQLMYYDPKA